MTWRRKKVPAGEIPRRQDASLLLAGDDGRRSAAGVDRLSCRVQRGAAIRVRAGTVRSGEQQPTEEDEKRDSTHHDDLLGERVRLSAPLRTAATFSVIKVRL